MNTTAFAVLAILAAFAAFAVPAYADDLTMVMTLSTTGPTEAEAKNLLFEAARGVPGTIGEVSAAEAGGIWKASGSVTIHGGLVELSAVEDEYGGLAESVVIAGEGWLFGQVRAGSVVGFNVVADTYLAMALVFGVVAPVIAALSVLGRMWVFGAVAGGLFGAVGILSATQYLAHARYL